MRVCLCVVCGLTGTDERGIRRCRGEIKRPLVTTERNMHCFLGPRSVQRAGETIKVVQCIVCVFVFAFVCVNVSTVSRKSPRTYLECFRPEGGMFGGLERWT